MFRAALLIAILLTAPAFAQPRPCAERADILKTLSNRFGESPIGMGLMNTGKVLEVLASATGSWSIVGTDTTGTACVLAVGEAWSGEPTRLRHPLNATP